MQHHRGGKRKKIWLLRLFLLLLVLVVGQGCLARKLQGLEEIIQANPQGWDDAVNGSHYRDGSDHSERMMRSLGRYINQLEAEIERGD